MTLKGVQWIVVAVTAPSLAMRIATHDSLGGHLVCVCMMLTLIAIELVKIERHLAAKSKDTNEP